MTFASFDEHSENEYKNRLQGKVDGAGESEIPYLRAPESFMQIMQLFKLRIYIIRRLENSLYA